MPERKKPSLITTGAILAIISVLVLGGLYLARVSSKLTSLERRNFRIAATLAEMTEKKLDNVAKILRSEFENVGDVDHGQEPDSEGGQPIDVSRLQDLPCFHHVHWHPESGAATDATQPTIEATTSDMEFQLSEGKKGTLHIKAGINCFFSYLSYPEVFDDVLVVDSSGRVIFQCGDSSIRIRQLFAQPASAHEKGQNETTDDHENGFWPISLSNLQEVSFAGQRYALFRQPLRPDFNREGDDGVPVQWEVVAIVHSERLLSEALRFAPSLLAYVVAFVVLTLCVLPLVDVWDSSTRERIHPRQVWTTSIGLTLGTAVLTLLALDNALKWAYQDSLKGKLEANANEIEEALETEIEDAIAQLEYLKDCYSETRIGRHLPRDGATGNLFKSGLSWKVENERGETRTLRYPHLEMVYWTDREGKQVTKWAVAKKPTPLINVQEREYFQRARDGNLWSPQVWTGNKPPPSEFFVEAIRSWTTGTQEVVVSQKTNVGAGQEDAPSDQPIAAMAITKLPSMLRPLLPPGCGFAVIDTEPGDERDGRVIFHSHPERNGAENFVEECEEAPELVGAILANAPRHFSSRYWGEEHVMFARPLAGLPWHIVVFQEKMLLQTARLEAIEVSLVLLLLEGFLMVAALLGIRLVGGSGSFHFLWPAPADAISYARIVAISVLMILGLLASIFFLHSPQLLVLAGLLVPLAAVAWIASATTAAAEPVARHRWFVWGMGLLSVLVLLAAEYRAVFARDQTGWLVCLVHAVFFAAAGVVAWKPHWTKPYSFLTHFFHRRSPTTRFAVAGAFVLAVVSAAPAALFLWAASQDRLNLECRRGQLHLVEDMTERHRQIKSEYGRLDDSLLEKAVEDVRDVHYEGYFQIVFTPGADSSPRDAAAPPLRSLFSLWPLNRLYYLNRHSVEARATGEQLSESSSWLWTTESSRPVLKGSPFGGGSEVEVKSTAFASIGSSVAGFSLIALLFAAVLVIGLVFMGRHIFLVDFQPPLVPSLAALKRRHFTRLLLVVPPRSQTSCAFKNADVTLDFNQTGTPAGEETLDELRERLPKAKFVQIDHLETLLADASARAKALPLFQSMLAKPTSRFQMVVFSHRDPSAVLETEQARLAEGPAGPEQRNVLERWREMLDRFTQKRILLEPKKLETRMGQEIDDFHRDLWRALSRDERHLLVQIAEGSLVNRGLSRPLRRLFAWDLVERAHLAFRVKHDAFRDFIRDRYDPEALREWEREAATGLWRQVRVPFYWTLGLVIIFLLVTQRELFDVTFGLISTAAGSLAAVIKILDSLRKSRQGT